MHSCYTQRVGSRHQEKETQKMGALLPPFKVQKAGDRKLAKKLERGGKRVKRVCCSCREPQFAEEMVTTTFWNSKFHGDTGKHVVQEHTCKKTHFT